MLIVKYSGSGIISLAMKTVLALLVLLGFILRRWFYYPPNYYHYSPWGAPLPGKGHTRHNYPEMENIRSINSK